MVTWIKVSIKATELTDISFNKDNNRYYFIAKQPQSFIDGKVVSTQSAPIGNESEAIVKALHEQMTNYLNDNDYIVVEKNVKQEGSEATL
jgi:hypothetical protein